MTVGPNLACMNGANALTESFNGFGSAKDTFGAGTKGIQDQVARRRLEKCDHACSREGGAQFAQDLETHEWSFVQTLTYHNDFN